MRIPFSLPLIFAAIGFALFGLAFWRVQMNDVPPRNQDRAIGRLEPAFGVVSIDRGYGVARILKPTAIQKLETIETSSESEASLFLPSGEEIRILENSTLIGDFESGHPVLIIQRGDIWPEKMVENPNTSGVLISRNGTRNLLTVDHANQKKLATRSREIPIAENHRATPIQKERSITGLIGDRKKSLVETLTSDYIQETIRTQRNLFFKCYGQLLQRTPGLHGEASIAFTIERTGKVSTAEVSSSTFQDPAFNKCLSEAVKRVEFRSFAGQPVETLFPLRFQ